MKILHIVENLDSRYGGPAKSVPLLVKYLDKLGIENKIFTIQWWENEENPTVDEYNYNIERFKLSGIKKINYGSGFKEALKKEIAKDTIIHIHGIWTYPSYIAYKIARKYNVPYIVATRGMMYGWCLEQTKYMKKIVMKLYVKDMLKDANIIHITEENEELALKNIEINAKCSLVPNGIELEQEYDSLDKKILIDINYNKNKRYIIFLGRIVRKKGLHFLLESFQKMKNKFKNIEFLVVGNIEDKKYFNSLKQVSGVKFMGQLEGAKKHTLMSISKLFIAPSYSENFGIVIAEAMSYKLPVITTTGTPWQEIKEQDAGWWIDLTQENLDNALEEALKCSDDILANKGKNGYSIIQNYTWDKQAIKMKNVYKDIEI